LRLHGSTGASLAEALVVTALAAAAVLSAAPAVAHLRDAGRAGSAARSLAAQLREQRFRSIGERKACGLWFEKLAEGWRYREVVDGNGNGLRTAEIRSGVDRTVAGPFRVESLVAGARLGFPPGGPFPEVPPGTGSIPNTADPVQFGSSDVVSFTPLGGSSSGTLYFTDGATALSAVVVYGPTVRVRVLRFDPRERAWVR
jgi:hypothetical protein